MSSDDGLTRRDFMRVSALAGGGLLLARPVNALTGAVPSRSGTIRSRGYAAINTSGKLVPWEFERRPVGDNDVLIDIKYASICHSDIHQMMGHWGPQQYPQVPGHEIVGVVSAVGKNVTRFRVGDRAGVGCMVDSCLDCESCLHDGEQYCPQTLFTYGYPDKRSPTGITQGGYATNIVVRDHFAVHIPDHLSFQDAAPLLCAGITTYSPLMKLGLRKGDRVGVAGIGGLGHMAIQLAASRGAEVHAFTTSPDKVADIHAFGASEAVVVDSPAVLARHRATVDYMITTIPVQYDVASYVALVRPHGVYIQVGMPKRFELTPNILGLAVSRVDFRASLIGDMDETQDVVDYCANRRILPRIELIKAEQINQAWENVVNKRARYRYVIDASTFEA